jgi:hypothetical protein
VAPENAPPSRGSVDPAVSAARAVVGLYGDPTVTWSILFEVELASSVPRDGVSARAAELVRHNPHLGRTTDLVEFPKDRVEDVRHRFANDPYGDQQPLLRLALSTSGDRLVVGAHHGAMDGLGMLCTAADVLDVELGSSVRGMPDRPAGSGFLRSSVSRLWEAVARPPQRFRRSTSALAEALPGDWLVSGQVSTRHPTTSGLVVATRLALEDWNEPGRRARRPVVLAMGASRRRATERLRPDRSTAYARLDATEVWTIEQAKAKLDTLHPEPDFPATRALGIGPLVTGVLGSRLGSTALVSNVGRLHGSDLVVRAHFWPSASGPSGVGIGLVSVQDNTVLTVRARRADFDEKAAQRLHGLIGAKLEDQ